MKISSFALLHLVAVNVVICFAAAQLSGSLPSMGSGSMGSGTMPPMGSGSMPSMGSGSMPSMGSGSMPSMGSGSMPHFSTTAPNQQQTTGAPGTPAPRPQTPAPSGGTPAPSDSGGTTSTPSPSQTPTPAPRSATPAPGQQTPTPTTAATPIPARQTPSPVTTRAPTLAPRLTSAPPTPTPTPSPAGQTAAPTTYPPNSLVIKAGNNFDKDKFKAQFSNDTGIPKDAMNINKDGDSGNFILTFTGANASANFKKAEQATENMSEAERQKLGVEYLGAPNGGTTTTTLIPKEEAPGNSKMGLVIGIAVGVLALAAITYFVIRRKKGNDDDLSDGQHATFSQFQDHFDAYEEQMTTLSRV